MRVVNSIEREMLQAEWEDWLLQENVKCKRLGAILRENTTELSGRNTRSAQKVLSGNVNRVEEIRAWQNRYCESCSSELDIRGIVAVSRS